MGTIRADVAVLGGGLGGCAAALAAADLGCSVVLSEETAWLGGQLTSQAVPPDEHPWIESFGATASYRSLRAGIRAYYRRHLPLSAAARAERWLNPGGGGVSRLCHDPRVAVAVLDQLLARHVLTGRIRVLRRHGVTSAALQGDRVQGVALRDLDGGGALELSARFFLDATELGELLPLVGAEHVLGAEAQSETGEPHAAERADPANQQAVTVCFALEHCPGEDHTIARPERYAFWRDLRPAAWPGPLLGWATPDPRTLRPVERALFPAPGRHALWLYRRILDAARFLPDAGVRDVTLVNWPQNDYWLGPICGVPAEEAARHLAGARSLSLALLYWLQTEAPRPDGGLGYPGLRLRPDVVGGTADGLAMAPYVREARRIRAECTVREQDVASALRPQGPAPWADSVGIGCYRIDLHPSTAGDPYIDVGAWPFQIPLGALLPVRLDNLLPAAKNIGVTHVTQGCYRLHPVEWNVGEAAGALAAFCLRRAVPPRQVRAEAGLLAEYQGVLRGRGVELEWPALHPV